MLAPQTNGTRSSRIRELNDLCRRTFTGASIMATAAFTELPPELKATVLERVRTFTDFDEGNDPHHEHDMAFLDEGGERFFFKFDLYEEPEVKDSNGVPVVNRVLTIMLADEY